MSDDIIITIIDKEYFKIESGRIVYKSKYIPSSEYVAFHDKNDGTKIYFGDTVLQDAINNCEYSVTGKNFSPILTGLYIKTRGDNLTVVGTDSFRLVEYKGKTPQKNNANDVIIPVGHIRAIGAILNKYKSDVSMVVGETQSKFQYIFKDFACATTVQNIIGNFPEYDREEIIPTTGTIIIKQDAKELFNAIKTVSVLTKYINSFIEIQTNAGEMKILSGKTDQGEIETIIKSDSNQQISFGIKGLYISQFIRNTKSENLKFQLVDDQRPIVIFGDNKNVKYVIRPLINN